LKSCARSSWAVNPTRCAAISAIVAHLAQDVHIGNFVDVKASDVGAGAKINHLSYIGDASIGAKTNVGAGTITCDYDGFAKYRTEVGAHAFIICRGPPTRPGRWDSPLHNRD
jgi:acyl-[acyl carrier protein]--UDP-N-acetylglucosamine O-acyltransferase